MQQDFSQCISVVIDRSLPAWQAMNVLAHISGYFGYLLKENFHTDMFFTTKEGINIPRNTQYPIIVFQSDHNSVIGFAQRVRNMKGVEPMYFVKEMIETSDDNEIQTSISSKNFDDVEILGVGIFGENSLLKSLTKGFKLWS